MMQEEGAIFFPEYDKKKLWNNERRLNPVSDLAQTANLVESEILSDQDSSFDGQIYGTRKLAYGSRLLEQVCNTPTKYQRRL